MTKGIHPSRMKKVLETFQKYPGDPSIEAKVVEMHAILEDEYMRLRADAPETAKENIRFEGEKHSLYEALTAARNSFRHKKVR